MRFTKLVAIIAILGMTAQAYAAEGALRRSQNQTTSVAENEPASNEPRVIVIPAASVQTVTPPPAQAQPTTVVEANPVTDSKAESLRKARQNQEVHTEQKIVEKLEESRLKEEQQRAERLFGDKLDSSTSPAATVAPAPVQPQQQPAPVVEKTQQVTIEKIEIIQPQVEVKKPEEAPAVPAPAPAPAPTPAPAEATLQAQEEAPEAAPAAFQKKIFAGALVGVPSYGAQNIKTNYGLGANVGYTLDPNWTVEGALLYSNSNVDTFWAFNLYRQMDQYDIQAKARYNIMTGQLKPFVGGGVAYVYRKYTDRQKDPNYYAYVSPTSMETQAFNGVLMAGVDFDVSEKLTIGGSFEYNKPIMGANTPNFVQYGLPSNTKPVEEFDYYMFLVNARMSF